MRSEERTGPERSGEARTPTPPAELKGLLSIRFPRRGRRCVSCFMYGDSFDFLLVFCFKRKCRLGGETLSIYVNIR